MTTQTINRAREIAELPQKDVIRHEYVRSQFIYVYNSVWGEAGEAAYEREANYFNRIMRDNAQLLKCTPLSIYFAFIDLAVRGLTLAPGAQAVCYLLPRSSKTGQKASDGKDLYESRCTLTISGYGELLLRKKAGQISHADNPVIVYEGDTFSFGERDGRKYVEYNCTIPRRSNNIIACFIKITRADGTADYSVMLPSDWERLAGYSAKNNAYYDPRQGRRVEKANDLYTAAGGGIDPGFLAAKCIKHAFKSYPKLVIGQGTSLESDIAAEEEAQAIDNPYGEVDTPTTRMASAPTGEVGEPVAKGVVIDPSDDDDDTF